MEVRVQLRLPNQKLRVLTLTRGGERFLGIAVRVLLRQRRSPVTGHLEKRVSR